MTDPDYATILSAEYPTREWSINNNDYATLTMLDGGSKPTKAALDAKWPKVNYDNQYNDVAEQRRMEYQANTDGMYFHAVRHGQPLTEWEQAVAAIKAANPYPDAP
jgi:hypothetical protein